MQLPDFALHRFRAFGKDLELHAKATCNISHGPAQQLGAGKPERLSSRVSTSPVRRRSSRHSFSACDWLVVLTAHIPNAGEHLVRYYGWYSNVNRGKRRKAQGENCSSIEAYRQVASSEAQRAWAGLIRQVYQADPLACPRYAGPTGILASIEQPEIIEQILTHLGS